LLRIFTDESNPYWTTKYNYEFDLTDVYSLCENFNTTWDALDQLMDGYDEWITPKEAANFLGIPLRTFYYRKYTPIAYKSKTVRYSKNYLSEFLPNEENGDETADDLI